MEGDGFQCDCICEDGYCALVLKPAAAAAAVPATPAEGVRRGRGRSKPPTTSEGLSTSQDAAQPKRRAPRITEAEHARIKALRRHEECGVGLRGETVAGRQRALLVLWQRHEVFGAPRLLVRRELGQSAAR